MKIGIDVQALQSVNSKGGIGKYNRYYLRNLFNLYPENEYSLFYNGRYPDAYYLIDPVNAPHVDHKIIKYLPGNDYNPANRYIQRYYYKSRKLDCLHVLSPLEGQYYTVISGKVPSQKRIATLYDFIPYIFRDKYLPSKIAFSLYLSRTRLLKESDLLLSISEATRKDAISLFNIPPDRVVNIGLAASDEFYKIDDKGPALSETKNKYDIKKNFILTVSNMDHRKNLAGLLKAFVNLPVDILKNFCLVIVCNSQPEYVSRNQEIYEILTSNQDAEVRFIYSIPVSDLNILYNCCDLFVYASLYEGGGLPVLEAMQCGTPVITSNTSSMPEYAGADEILFNPSDIDDVSRLIARMLNDSDYRHKMGEYGYNRVKMFTWQNIVNKAVKAYKSIC